MAAFIERFLPYRRPVIVVVHVALVAVAYLLAFLLSIQDLCCPSMLA